MAQASLLACEGLAGVSLVPTAASKKMMLSQIASKQAENGERAGSPDMLRCSSQSHRKDSDKSRSRKDDDSLAEASHSKKTVKKVRSHLSVTYVICASSRSTTWSVTSVYTVGKSLTSVNGVIRDKRKNSDRSRQGLDPRRVDRSNPRLAPSWVTAVEETKGIWCPLT
ncbi:zinc finger protein 740 isoform X5 [Sagmatias obliquidens]|uniref:Zinc finger protein 740 isoform X4 n=1 Tax=Tursiops truncatus TaxID=9739 RepID=A0A6J3S680_TURTR|nr:zinc finger protein 740 isoform X5 [Lagenorhynchus obliquidens]XP_030722752.1 zinc finger protein 740 isoform X5 [Globicephala melas]XP_033722522.1 zinc finger protein 740 isoform X4 [Tursiops truncatus]